MLFVAVIRVLSPLTPFCTATAPFSPPPAFSVPPLSLPSNPRNPPHGRSIMEVLYSIAQAVRVGVVIASGVRVVELVGEYLGRGKIAVWISVVRGWGEGIR